MEFADIDKEYTKNKDLKKADIEALLSWNETQPHLPKIGELEMILFLHSCYYDLEKAQHTIDTYYTCKTHCPELFENWNVFDKNLQKAMDVMLFQPISEPTEEGFKIFFIKFQDSDSSKFKATEQIKLFCMSMTLWLMQEGTAEGYAIVVDMSALNSGHIMKINPLAVKKFFYFLQEAIPFRLKAFHFFDCYSVVDKFMMIFRPFIKDKLVYIHTKGNIEGLYKHVPKKNLPEDYGGLQLSSDKLHATMKDRLKTGADFLANLEKTHKVNEQLRPGKSDNCSIS